MFSALESIGRSSADFESVVEEKTVTFSQPQVQSPVSDALPSARLDSRDFTKMTEEPVMRVTGEIPIIEKRDRPSSGQWSRPSSAQQQGSRPGSASKLPPSRPTVKKDMSKILTHLKKNMYDDTG